MCRRAARALQILVLTENTRTSARDPEKRRSVVRKDYAEKEVLEDLMVAAHADARRKAEAVLQEKMKAVTGGLPLPPGLNLT